MTPSPFTPLVSRDSSRAYRHTMLFFGTFLCSLPAWFWVFTWR